MVYLRLLICAENSVKAGDLVVDGGVFECRVEDVDRLVIPRHRWAILLVVLFPPPAGCRRGRKGEGRGRDRFLSRGKDNYFFGAGTEKDHFRVEGWPGLHEGPSITPSILPPVPRLPRMMGTQSMSTGNVVELPQLETAAATIVIFAGQLTNRAS